MNIDLQQGSSASSLSLNRYSLSFNGSPLDERGQTAVSALSVKSDVTYTVEYDGRSMGLKVNGQSVALNHLTDVVISAGNGPIALETTTLGFVEVLLCCRAIHGRVAGLECLYVEPEDYRRSSESHLLAKRDFELSGEIIGFRGIPGAARMLNDRRIQKCVFFVGYEGARFRRAFTDLEMLKGRNSYVVFGVPAFKPGWEMDSIANNIPVMRDESVSSVYFCGADNPRAAADFLLSTYESLQQDEMMFVAPIGTKPHGIGTALFAAQHRDIGVIYDHPLRSPDRSTSVGQWHKYTIADFC